MSLPIMFNREGKVYGLLFPMGAVMPPDWEMNFYSTERGRNTGIAYLRRLLGDEVPLYKFELTLGEVVKRSVIVPLIPKDHTGALGKVAKIEKQHMKSERPKWRNN